MSERGMLLALQRLHDDPGFIGMVCSDPERTLGLYDLDDNDRATLAKACQNRDDGTLAQLARSYGVDWQQDHVTGVGALDDSDVNIEQSARTGGKGAGTLMHTGPGSLGGDGYEGAMPNHPTGT